MTLESYLSVGEVDGDHVGCYLFGMEATPVSPISYHSVATSHAELISDCTSFFKELLEAKERLVRTSIHAARHKQEREIIHYTLANLPSLIAMHLASGMNAPLLSLGGIVIFLRTGMRQREKLNGSYIE
jgi:hypothetical protein